VGGYAGNTRNAAAPSRTHGRLRQRPRRDADDEAAKPSRLRPPRAGPPRFRLRHVAPRPRDGAPPSTRTKLRSAPRWSPCTTTPAPLRRSPRTGVSGDGVDDGKPTTNYREAARSKRPRTIASQKVARSQTASNRGSALLAAQGRASAAIAAALGFGKTVVHRDLARSRPMRYIAPIGLAFEPGRDTSRSSRAHPHRESAHPQAFARTERGAGIRYGCPVKLGARPGPRRARKQCDRAASSNLPPAPSVPSPLPTQGQMRAWNGHPHRCRAISGAEAAIIAITGTPSASIVAPPPQAAPRTARAQATART